jgi:hypothetical protein
MLKPLQVKKLRKEHFQAREKARKSAELEIEAQRAARVQAFLASDLSEKIPIPISMSIIDGLRTGKLSGIPTHLAEAFEAPYPTMNYRV